MQHILLENCLSDMLLIPVPEPHLLARLFAWHPLHTLPSMSARNGVRLVSRKLEPPSERQKLFVLAKDLANSLNNMPMDLLFPEEAGEGPLCPNLGFQGLGASCYTWDASTGRSLQEGSRPRSAAAPNTDSRKNTARRT